MILSIKSFNELMLTSQSEAKGIRNFNKTKLSKSIKNSHPQKHIKAENKNFISLPNIPELKIRKWVKGKEAVSRFFDELDYNNQIQSSYDLTLLERQRSHDQNNVA